MGAYSALPAWQKGRHRDLSALYRPERVQGSPWRDVFCTDDADDLWRVERT
ncbi:hypothetical protein BN439_3931 [Erwinia amylovora Ea644]|nr:hypothetical protein BN439_3931 [Erwinia amylovora Ea644]CCP09036.1 hypothetical protein BN440_4053 [Erwinia amylovora MR1]